MGWLTAPAGWKRLASALALALLLAAALPLGLKGALLLQQQVRDLEEPR